MANDSPAAGQKPASPQPSASLSATERSRLAQWFVHGQQSTAKNIDIAIEMFANCVAGDPGNAAYLQHFLGALRIKHGSKKGGGLAALWSAGGRGSLRKLGTAGKWRDVLVQGVGIIKTNPGDHGALLVMAEAASHLGHAEVQRVLLKAALDAAPSDVEVNRKCAEFLVVYGEYDQAIACWLRIKNVKGMADEAEREISRLQVEKTITDGRGMLGRKAAEAAKSESAAGAGKSAAAQATGGAGKADPGVEQPAVAGATRADLERAIAENPGTVEPYLDLADLLEREGSLDEAQRMLERALSASGNAIQVREHVEDRQLRWGRNQLHVAEKRLAEEDSPENRSVVERLRSGYLKREIDIYAARVARHPENIAWKHELAVRLKASGNHSEAIKYFQDVIHDARRKGAVALDLGECFQKIRQYSLAMRSYQTAVESLTDRELDLRKRALYRAGVLAAGLDDEDAARKYLSTLAELDFGYRDVAERLDKLTPTKDKELDS